jgi:hypothetical protein
MSSNEHLRDVVRLETIQILQILTGERGTELLVSDEGYLKRILHT